MHKKKMQSFLHRDDVPLPITFIACRFISYLEPPIIKTLPLSFFSIKHPSHINTLFLFTKENLACAKRKSLFGKAFLPKKRFLHFFGKPFFFKESFMDSFRCSVPTLLSSRLFNSDSTPCFYVINDHNSI